MDTATKQQLLLKAGASHIETTISQACELLDITGTSTLERISELNTCINSLNMELIPGIEKESLTTTRILRSKTYKKTNADILKEIQKGESFNLEFKSSLLTDLKRFKYDKSAKTKDLRSDQVIHSALKTIAAFMNTDGGLLYLGVTDDCSICGLDHDLQLLPDGKNNWDGWELEFMQLVDNQFNIGRGTHNYVKLSLHSIDNKTIARVEVTPSQDLILITKKTNEYVLYRRQANRTIAVKIEQLEDFYKLKKL